MNTLYKNLKRKKRTLADLEAWQAEIRTYQELLKSVDVPTPEYQAELDELSQIIIAIIVKLRPDLGPAPADLDTLAQIVAKHIAQTQADLSQAQSEYNKIYPGLVLKRRVKQNFYAMLLFTAICTGTFFKSFSDSEHVAAYKTAAVLSALFGLYHYQQTRNYNAKLRDFVNNQKHQR